MSKFAAIYDENYDDYYGSNTVVKVFHPIKDEIALKKFLLDSEKCRNLLVIKYEEITWEKKVEIVL